jgi:hypothetical protein
MSLRSIIKLSTNALLQLGLPGKLFSSASRMFSSTTINIALHSQVDPGSYKVEQWSACFDGKHAQISVVGHEEFKPASQKTLHYSPKV